MTGAAVGTFARLAAVALVLMLAVATSFADDDRDKPLAVGDRAPGLELGDQDGKPFALADALRANRYVVLAFYPKAFTGG